MSRTHRRGALAALAITALLIVSACSSGSSSSGGSGGSGSKVVYINSSGGTLDDAYRKAFWDPFTAATGIKVVNTAPVDEAKLATMVKTNTMSWDITEVSTGGDLSRDATAGYLQKIDQSSLPMADMLPGAVVDYGVLDSVAAYVVSWNLSTWPLSGKHPTSTADLWNQTDFPGKRCMFKDAQFNLELAVMDAGTPQSKVYPIDQDLAYKQLDLLKPNVSLWYSSPAQSIQALLAGDCVMAGTFNGRVFSANSGGDKLGISFANAASDPAYWAIPKGAPDYDNAVKLLAFMQDPKRQAAAADLIAYSGGNSKTAQYISPSAKKYFATAPDNLPVTLKLDDTWWAQNATAAEARFLTWVTG